jgi:hypothetical protein
MNFRSLGAESRSPYGSLQDLDAHFSVNTPQGSLPLLVKARKGG